jgi:hypothetical protein
MLRMHGLPLRLLGSIVIRKLSDVNNIAGTVGWVCRLIFQHLKRGISQGICISGEILEMFFKSERRVGVDEVGAVLYPQATSGEVAPMTARAPA